MALFSSVERVWMVVSPPLCRQEPLNIAAILGQRYLSDDPNRPSSVGKNHCRHARHTESLCLQIFRQNSLTHATAGKIERKPVHIQLSLAGEVDQHIGLTDIP